MASSILTAVKGELRKTSAFGLSTATELKLKDIWEPSAHQIQHDELWITYPFEETYDSLGATSRHPELATVAKEKINLHLNSIVEHATQFGLDEFRAKWTLGELLTNATQYGALSETNATAGLIRLEWMLERDESGPTLAVAVANPCVHLFDPSSFARMEKSDFFAMEGSSCNGHLGTIALLSYLKDDTKLTYVWETTNGERIKLTMELMPEDAPDRPANYDDLMKPIRLEARRFDAANQTVPYSFEQFEQDVKNGTRVESVTVSCVVAGPTAPNET